MTDILRALVTGRTPPQTLEPGELQLVVDHRLHGLLQAAVDRGQVELDERQATEQRATMLVERTHRAKIERTLGSALDEADELGVRLAVFKGLSLEAQWYDHPLERPFSDLDLLLAPAHFASADDLVARLHPGHPLQGSIARLFSDHRLQSIEVRIADGAVIDLHADPLKIEIPMRQLDRVWTEELPMVEFAGRRIPTLPSEVALVQLLLHLNKDRFAYLSNVADVVRMLERASLDWDRIEAFARSEGVLVHVAGALQRVTAWAGVDGVPHLARTSPLWRMLWPAALVGQGRPGIARHRRRQLWIPLTARGRALEAARSLWRRWVRVDPVVRASLVDRDT